MPLSHAEVSVGEEDDNEQNERVYDNSKKKKKKTEAEGNRFLIPYVSKAKKRIVSKIRRKPLSLNMASSSLPPPRASASSSGFWKRVCFCGIEPPNTMEFSSSCSSDPKDENFTVDMLRVLLETNHFFSKDSNPHL